jgi:hypothetical protein
MSYPSPATSQPNITVPPVSPAPSDAEAGLTESQRRGIVIRAVVVIVLLVVGAVAAAIWLVQNPAQAASVRDVFIIFMALEFMLVGVALVVLMVQVAILTNMLQHEIKPILESTTETLNTVRGTTAFLSENLVDPVIKLNAALAALSQVLDTLNVFGRFGRKK